MSEFPGWTLEELIWDTWGRYQGRLPESWPTKIIDPGLKKRLVEFYEPYRAELESRLDNYDQDERPSWSDYKYCCVWDGIPDPPPSIFVGTQFEEK